MKIITSLLIAAVMLVPAVSSAQTLTEAQRTAILAELQMLETELVNLLAQQTSSSGTTSTTTPVLTPVAQNELASCNAQVSNIAYEITLLKFTSSIQISKLTGQFVASQAANITASTNAQVAQLQAQEQSKEAVCQSLSS